MKTKITIGAVIILILVIGNIVLFNLFSKQVKTSEEHKTFNQTDNFDGEIKEGQSFVYMTNDISSESLIEIYEKLGVTLNGNIAVKVSTGEAGGNNYLKKDLIGDLVKQLNGTIVENNTAYGGSRSSTEKHKQVARDHGFYDIANVDILDEDGSIELEVKNGKHLTTNYIGSHYNNYDGVLVLSHFKGHAMAGFGGAIKNISIGFASSKGKANIHNAGSGTNGINWSTNQDAFLESMAEAAKTIQDNKGEQIVYINVMNRLSVDCDCDSNPAEPAMHDIGILASTDPVAVDQACIDLVYKAEDGASLIKRIESRNGLHTLSYANEIGLGNQNYVLVDIND